MSKNKKCYYYGNEMIRDVNFYYACKSHNDVIVQYFYSFYQPEEAMIKAKEIMEMHSIFK